MAILELTKGISEENMMRVYSDPYIARVGYDGGESAPVIHPLAEYVSAWIDGAFAGAFLAIHYTRYEIEVHALLLKDAVKRSRELGMKFIDWCFIEHDIQRITGYVIEGLKSAYNYCIRLGFIDEGFRRDVCMVNNEKRGVHVLGMTRDEWERL